MIRLVQRKLIIPRGDTGSFTIPAIAATSQADVAVFTIFDCLTRTKVCEDKIASPSNDTFTFVFTHGDTVNLKPGKYMWDVKFYKNPVYADGKLVNGEEIDSYYAGYSLPNCEIRETGDDMLVSPDAPGNSLTPAQIDIITAALNQIEEAVEETQSNVAHYPYVGEDDHWYVWDAEHNEFVDTGVIAAGPGVAEGGITGQILKKASNADFDTEWGNETDPTVPAWAKAETKPTYTAEEVGALPDNTFIPTNTSDLNNDSNFAVDANYVHTDNNYTSEEKLKLSGIATGAEVNVNADWNAVSGDAQILNKPTNVSSFTNDAGYLVAADIEGKQDTLTFDLTPTALSTNPVTSDGIKDYVDTAVSTINTMRIHICTAQEYDASTGIPTVQNPDTQTFYLVPGGNSGNLYIEWVYVDNAWERFGSADIDLSGYATKADTVLDTTLSRGRVANSTVGTGSFAFGDSVTASGAYAHAEGRRTSAVHQGAHAEGLGTTAHYAAHAEGEDTIARGQWSHAEGCNSQAIGAASYAGGKNTIANGTASHVFGEVNVPDSYDNWPAWEANTEYSVGDRVTRVQTVNNESTTVGYICKEANSDSTFTIAHWDFDSNHMNYAEIVGNGTITEDPETHEEVRNGVNIRTLDWYGNEHLKGDLYVQDNANGTGGVKVATINQIPEVPVTDVQVNGTSVVTSGVANVPVAGPDTFGVAKVGGYGIFIYSDHLRPEAPSLNESKAGTSSTKILTPQQQHTAAFYGLAKAAGDTTQSASSNAVGTYTDSAKSSIRSMLGATSPDIIAVQDAQPTAADNKIWIAETAPSSVQVPTVDEMNTALAGKVSDVTVNGSSVVTDGVAAIPPSIPSGGSTGQVLKKTSGTDYDVSWANESGAVTDVQVDGTSVVTSGVANIPASASPDIIVVQDAAPSSAGNKIWISETTPSSVQVPTTDEMNTALAGKVSDVQVNGTSVVTSGVANIPVASNSALGVVIGSNETGVRVDTGGILSIAAASASLAKAGSDAKRPITPYSQHVSVFYGLSKLAGVDLASESVTVGTYPDSSKTAINTMIGSVSKYNLDNAGITAKTYDVKFDGEFSVTTATNASYISPYARASVTGRISKHYMHKVTVNGTEYILPTRLWYEITGTVGIKVYEYLGNLGLYKADVSGVPDGTDNVPFVIISDLNNSNSIDVLTQTAGTYTIKVEQINNIQTKLPNSLIWADNYVPIEKKNNGGTYNGFSIGVNELKNTRGTFAIGYCNSIQNEFNIAIGSQNVMTGSDSIAIGHGCNVSGTFSTAFGVDTHATTDLMFVLGRANRNANTTIGTWATNTYYEAGTMVRATIYSVTTSFICKISHTSSTSFVDDFSNWAVLPSNGDTAFVIGNGMLGSTSGSNAVKINWAGGAFFGSDVYVNCDNTSANGKKVATVDQIPSVPVQDVQINGTSIISGGIANIPQASTNDYGVIKVQTNGAGGVYLTSLGKLSVFSASIDTVKPGTDQFRPITPCVQHQSTFYGLTKAAGVDMASSANAVGTYTDAAKAAIQHMLGTDTNLAPYESDTTADAAYAVGEMFMLNGKLHHATAAIAIGDTLTVGTNCAVVNASEVFPHDVQVNGTSVVSSGVANVPKATTVSLGVVKAADNLFGISIDSGGNVTTYPASNDNCKAGTSTHRPLVPATQHLSVFYGLAKAAGDTSQAASSNAVGTYTADAKAAIQTMLGVTPATIAALVDIPLIETVTGTTPTITGQPNTRYNCGEVTSISITPPSSGGVDVFFTSGSTPALLTVPNTVVWPEWFDATTLDTNTVYEILIIDGTYGSVMTWAT